MTREELRVTSRIEIRGWNGGLRARENVLCPRGMHGWDALREAYATSRRIPFFIFVSLAPSLLFS
jgi:hypothetical protein